MSRAFVLLSGGIDSTTCLAVAAEEFDGNVSALSIDYGQRHIKEIAYASQTCTDKFIPFNTLDLKSIVPQTMLTDPGRDIPSKSYDEIEGVSPTYVPFRNGLLLSAVTSFVHGRLHLYDVNANEVGIYFGAHAEDAHNWAYPDCTPEFIGAMANAIYIGSYREVRLHTPLQWLNKKQIIELGTRLGVNWANTWSCYKGGEIHCGECPTCRARRKAFMDAGVADPTEYAVSV